MAKGLSASPRLKEIGFTASRCLLDVQRISHDPAEGAAALAALTQPVISPAPAPPGMPIDQPAPAGPARRPVRLPAAAHGFTNRDLRNHLAPLLGLDPQAMTSGQITYDLRPGCASTA